MVTRWAEPRFWSKVVVSELFTRPCERSRTSCVEHRLASAAEPTLSATAKPGTAALSATSNFQPASVRLALKVASPRLRPLGQLTE